MVVRFMKFPAPDRSDRVDCRSAYRVARSGEGRCAAPPFLRLQSDSRREPRENPIVDTFVIRGWSVKMITLQIINLVLVALVLATTLAHALELPGKLRLSQPEYWTVQQIYYPGFTIAGVAEPLAVLGLGVQAVAIRDLSAPLWLV